MILKSLVSFYESMLACGQLPPPGWVNLPIAYVLDIDKEGSLINVIPTMAEVSFGRKKGMVPISRKCPARVSRSSGVKSNFLCDHSGYILGVDEKGNLERTAECFACCKALHHELLDGIRSDTAQAILAFFDRWEPEKAKTHEALKDVFDDLILGKNLLLRYSGHFPTEDKEIAEAWERYYNAGEDEGVCLVTGQYGVIEKIHPLIGGVRGAQSSGAAVVSFNAPSLLSYGKEQNLNAPTSRYAAHAYTSALNYLIKDNARHFYVGDTAVLFWMNASNDGGERLARFAFDDEAPDGYTKDELWEKIKTLAQGKAVVFDDSLVDPEQPFYVLGIVPNAARLSVRFFCQNSFGSFLKNVWAHHERLRIVRSSDRDKENIPLWQLLRETVNQEGKNKDPSPHMANAVLRAVLTDTPYPATLLNGVFLRIRAEQNVTYGRAAIIKAYYLKNRHADVPKEVLTMSLNKESSNIPYCLGRLFAVLEKLQNDANKASTVKDHYFVSAATTPSSIFTILLQMAKHHLKKIKSGGKEWLAAYYDKMICEITDKFGEKLPIRLTLAEQSCFQLGYYHQRNALYQKKEDEENV